MRRCPYCQGTGDGAQRHTYCNNCNGTGEAPEQPAPETPALASREPSPLLLTSVTAFDALRYSHEDCSLHLDVFGEWLRMEDVVPIVSALQRRVQELEQSRDEYRTLAGIGKWHDDCRPNRHMAARELAKSQEIINRLADTIAERERQLAAAEGRAANYLDTVALAADQEHRAEAAESYRDALVSALKVLVSGVRERVWEYGENPQDSHDKLTADLDAMYSAALLAAAPADAGQERKLDESFKALMTQTPEIEPDDSPEPKRRSYTFPAKDRP